MSKPEEESDGSGPDFPPGSIILCKYRDGTLRKATVIYARSFEDGGETKYKYYVHYDTFNRRMDTWVDPDACIPYNEDQDAGPAVKRRRTDKGEEVVHETIEVEHDEHEGMDESAIREHEEVTKVKNVNSVELGRYRMDTWYFSPLPKELFVKGPLDMLYFCEFSLKFFRTKEELRRWQARKPARHPPGNEIYRKGSISMFEIDGGKEREYSQNLCYLAKLFLDHKTLFYDVEPFLFYVLCELDDRGYHPVGYFSKEKYSDQGYNLACILTFPCHQRKGYGRFLIDFSYALSWKESKVGSPEKPLSDLGLLSYRSYWSYRLLEVLKEHRGEQLSIVDLIQLTSMTTDDIVTTLQYLGLLRYMDGSYMIVLSDDLLHERLEVKKPKGPVVDKSRLRWAPFRDPSVKEDKWRLSAVVNAINANPSGQA